MSPTSYIVLSAILFTIGTVGFMAACTKIAAVGALMRVFYVALGADRWDWQPVMAIIAVATMKLAYRSAILASSEPGSPPSRVVMMSRTAASA